ncbi:MAG: hypothetical protein AAGD07_25285 [Planctomycetota bacterium]
MTHNHHGIPRAIATRPRSQFHLWQLFAVTTVFALAFSVMRVVGYETAFSLTLLGFVFSPCLSFAVSAMLFPRCRSRRVLMRRIFLFGSAAASLVLDWYFAPGAAGSAVLFAMLVLWGPQLLLLRKCSRLRIALSDPFA